MDEIETRLAHRLASLRAERGWSLDELAQKSGVSRASLSRIEKGEVSRPPVCLESFALPLALRCRA